MEIAWYAVNMKPDNYQAGERTHTIEYRDRIFLWRIP
jgi:hypothetical protein